jgi:hypothetical protein
MLRVDRCALAVARQVLFPTQGTNSQGTNAGTRAVATRNKQPATRNRQIHYRSLTFFKAFLDTIYVAG